MGLTHVTVSETVSPRPVRTALAVRGDMAAVGTQGKKPVTLELVCPEVGDTQANKILSCDRCEETVWTNVTSSTTNCGLVWFMCCLCCCCVPMACLPFFIRD